MEHNLHRDQLLAFRHLAEAAILPIPLACRLISGYIYDRTGKNVDVIPNNQELFEQAATVATSYFLLIEI